MKNQLKIHPELFDELKLLKGSIIDENGHERGNPVPTFKNVNVRPPTLQEQIQRLLRHELSAQVKSQGAETFDEANDFDVPDDMPEPISNYLVLEEEEIPPSLTTPAEPEQAPEPDPEVTPEPPAPPTEEEPKE